MKLPGIRYQTAGPDVSALPLREARAWSGAVENINEAVQDYARKKNDESARQEIMDYRTGMADIDAMLAKPVLELNEIPANVPFQRTEKKLVNGVMTDVPRTAIPTYEVQEAIYAQAANGYKERARENLNSSAFRMYEQSWNEYNLAGSIRNNQQQVKHAHKDEVDKFNAQLNGLRERGLLDDADVLIDGANFISEGEKALLKADVSLERIEAQETARKEAFTAPIYDAMRDEDVTRLQQAREMLDQNPEVLGPEATTILDSKIRTRINSILSKQKATADSYVKGLKADAKLLGKSLDNGYQAEPDEIMSLYTQLLASDEIDAANDLMRSADINGKINYLASLPGEEANATMLQWTQESQDDPEMFNRMAKIREGWLERAKNLEEDTVGELQRTGENIPPVNFDDPASMRFRQQQVAIEDERLGGVSGYISKQEEKALNARMERGSLNERLQTIVNITDGFGSEARKVFTQSKMSSSAPEVFYAGELYRQAPETSQSILRGIDILKNDKNFLKNHERDLNINSDLLEASMDFPPGASRLGYMNAIRARYADLVAQVGATGYDSDLVDQAIADVSLGRTTYSGSTFVEPIPEMPGSFEQFMDTKLTPDYIRSLGNPIGVTPEQLVDGLRDDSLFGSADFVLRPADRNAFYIMFADRPGAMVMEEYRDPKTGGLATRPFRFFYDPVREQTTQPEDTRTRVDRRGRPLTQEPMEIEEEEPTFEPKPRFDRRGRPINRGPEF